MGTVTLLTGSPIDPATRAAVPVRLAGGGVGPYAFDNFEDWLAGLGPPPLFQAALGYDKNGWTGGAVPTTGEITFSPATEAALSRVASLYWLGQTVTIRVGDDAASPIVFATVLTGKIAAQNVEGGVLSLALSDLSGDLVKPFAPDRFAGTGGIEGDTGVEGRAKRRSLGRVFNVEGRVLLAADNIYEFGDLERPLQQFDAVRDKGRAADDVTVVNWQGNALNTLNTLRQTPAPPGGGVACPSIACVKWWTQPSGPLTADLRGEIGDAYVETAPEIASRIVSTSSTLAVANTSEMAGLRAGIAGIHVDDNSQTAANTLDRLLLGVSLLWLVEPAGQVRLREWSFGGSGLTPQAWAQGNAVATPWTAAGGVAVSWGVVGQVAATVRSEAVTRRSVLPPISSRRVGYQRNNRQHTDGEISEAIRYADGDLIDDFKPITPGADNTAQSQTGQVVQAALNADGSVKDGKVGTGSIVPSAVQQTKYMILASDQSVAQNTIKTVASVTFTKGESNSLLKVTFSGMFWSGDDLQFNCSVVVDGTTSYSCGQQNNVFDGTASGAKATIAPFVYITLAAGQHTIGFNVQNIESDNIALIVKAGSALEVLEIKQGAQ